MKISEKVIHAAINGPETKNVKIKESDGPNEHEFNVKPISISLTCEDETIVFGQISHQLTLRKDDQYWYGFKKNGASIKPNAPNKMILEKEEGGIVKTINILKPIGVVVGAYFGVDAGKYFDFIDKHADEVSFIDLDNGYKKAIKNFLGELSRRIKPPKPLTQKGLVLFVHDNFRGSKKLISTGDNVRHFKDIGWNDKASSLQALVPKGMKLELFQHDTFRGKKLEFGCGSHYISDLKIHKLGDELTSCRWIK